MKTGARPPVRGGGGEATRTGARPLARSDAASRGTPGPGPTRVCRLDDIPRLGARRHVRPDGETVAIFRTAEDAVFALADRCPHKGGPLSQGIVFGASVACPLHNWCIDLASGAACAPDDGTVKRFPVRVVDGTVELV